jgi:predicted HicB family RNase H-like nuclease
VATSLRLPADLYARLKAEAARQDRSINSLIVHIVRRWVESEARA